MKRYWGWVFLLCSLSMNSASAFACKMMPMTSSIAAVSAVLLHVKAQTKGQDREIKQIRRVSADRYSWAYVVEITGTSKAACQALGYEVTFTPSCGAKVQKLTTQYMCK